jgi:glycosyltransferase involved in cell wall biosynthesis
MRDRTLVFIPAWNEERSLPVVLAEAHGSLAGVDLLVIDDGSTDGTAAAARAAGADVVSFDENRGLREGIAEGYRQALVRGYDFCGRLDADGQHPAAELTACSIWSGPMPATSRSARASCRARARTASGTSRRRSASSAPRCCGC